MKPFYIDKLMFIQFHNFLEVEYLPVFYPLEIKQDNALHYGEDIFVGKGHITSHALMNSEARGSFLCLLKLRYMKG